MTEYLDDVPGLSFIGRPKQSSVTVDLSSSPVIEPTKTGKSSINLSNLNPDIQERLALLSDLYKNDTALNPKGEDLPITSGFRTRDEQRQLYLDRPKNSNLVAEPGKSRHEVGNAIDLHPRVPDSLLEQVGFHRPYGSKDIYHVEINPNSSFTPSSYMEDDGYGINFAKPTAFATTNPSSFAEDFRKSVGEMSYEDFKNKSLIASAAKYAGASLGLPTFGEEDKKQLEEKAKGFVQGVKTAVESPVETAKNVYKAVTEHPGTLLGEMVKGAVYDPELMFLPGVKQTAQLVGKGVKATGEAIAKNVTVENAGNLLSEISGKMTATSPYNTKRAFKAGYQKNPAILEAAKEGAVSAPEIVGSVREAFKNVKESRKQAYQEGIQTTKGNQVFLDFIPIREAFDKIVDSLKSKGVGGVEASKVGPETMAKVHEIEIILSEWEKKPQLHTAGGLDDLKQRIDDVYSSSMTGEAKRVMTATRNAVKDTIVKQDKNYEKTMADYEKGLELEREIQKALSLGDKTGIDTTIRKLAQVFSNKSTLSKEYRLELLIELERVGGKDIIDKLAGYAMGQSTPGGLQLLGDLVIGAGAHMVSPEAGLTTLATLAAAQSPKLALYSSYGAGRATRAVSDVATSAKEQVAKGKTKLSEITGRK